MPGKKAAKSRRQVKRPKKRATKKRVTKKPARSGARYSKNYSKFVMGLATDPNKMAKFEADPGRALKTAGLTNEEIGLIQSRDSRAILANVDPKAYEEIRTFHVHIHVDLISIPPQINTIAIRLLKRRRKQ